jgi:hypothetical protein
MAEKKNAAAVELGRLGGSVKTRKGFGKLSKAERIRKAKEGAAARWAKAKKKAKPNV